MICSFIQVKKQPVSSKQSSQNKQQPPKRNRSVPPKESYLNQYKQKSTTVQTQQPTLLNNTQSRQILQKVQKKPSNEVQKPVQKKQFLQSFLQTNISNLNEMRNQRRLMRQNFTEDNTEKVKRKKQLKNYETISKNIQEEQQELADIENEFSKSEIQMQKEGQQAFNKNHARNSSFPSNNSTIDFPEKNLDTLDFDEFSASTSSIPTELQENAFNQMNLASNNYFENSQKGKQNDFSKTSNYQAKQNQQREQINSFRMLSPKENLQLQPKFVDNNASFDITDLNSDRDNIDIIYLNKELTPEKQPETRHVHITLKKLQPIKLFQLQAQDLVEVKNQNENTENDNLKIKINELISRIKSKQSKDQPNIQIYSKPNKRHLTKSQEKYQHKLNNIFQGQPNDSQEKSNTKQSAQENNQAPKDIDEILLSSRLQKQEEQPKVPTKSYFSEQGIIQNIQQEKYQQRSL